MLTFLTTVPCWYGREDCPGNWGCREWPLKGKGAKEPRGGEWEHSFSPLAVCRLCFQANLVCVCVCVCVCARATHLWKMSYMCVCARTLFLASLGKLGKSFHSYKLILDCGPTCTISTHTCMLYLPWSFTHEKAILIVLQFFYHHSGIFEVCSNSWISFELVCSFITNNTSRTHI